MTTYIASLSDLNLSENIEFRVSSIGQARWYVERAGLWTAAPVGDGDVLLSSPTVFLYEDRPPFHVDDDLRTRIEDSYPTHVISIGPRGGIRTERVG